jgi:hypothetical protein
MCRGPNRSPATVEPVSPPQKRKLEKSEQRPAPETRAQTTEMPEIAGQRPAPAGDFRPRGKYKSMHFTCRHDQQSVVDLAISSRTVQQSNRRQFPSGKPVLHHQPSILRARSNDLICCQSYWRHHLSSKASPRRSNRTVASGASPTVYWLGGFAGPWPGFIEQAGTSPALAQRVTHPVGLRILLSIGPTKRMHLQTWQDKAGNAPPLTDPTNGLTFPDLTPPSAGDLFKGQPDHAGAMSLPQP